MKILTTPTTTTVPDLPPMIGIMMLLFIHDILLIKILVTILFIVVLKITSESTIRRQILIVLLHLKLLWMLIIVQS